MSNDILLLTIIFAYIEKKNRVEYGASKPGNH